MITAGVAVVFWPAAPFVRLRRGKDIDINKGVTFDVFVDGNHTLNAAPAQVSSATPPATALAPRVAAAAPPAAPAGDPAAVTVTSGEPGADIEINGNFVGNTPTTLKLAPGQYTITVRNGGQVWQRVFQATAGSSVTLNASFESIVTPVAQRRR